MIEREEAEKFRQIKDKYESGKELADPEADKEEYEHPAPTK